MKIKLEPHYSEDLSEKFWDLINNLPEPAHSKMYFAGILLQDIEDTVLMQLEMHLNEEKTK